MITLGQNHVIFKNDIGLCKRYVTNRSFLESNSVKVFAAAMDRLFLPHDSLPWYHQSSWFQQPIFDIKFISTQFFRKDVLPWIIQDDFLLLASMKSQKCCCWLWHSSPLLFSFENWIMESMKMMLFAFQILLLFHILEQPPIPNTAHFSPLVSKKKIWNGDGKKLRIKQTHLALSSAFCILIVPGINPSSFEICNRGSNFQMYRQRIGLTSFSGETSKPK